MSSIGSIINGSVSSLTGASSVSSTSSVTRAKATSASGADTAAVSGPAAMLNKLKKLKESDPATFKEVMSDISSKLKEAADSSGSQKDKAAMADLAQRFATAGQTGDLSTLAPPQGGKGGGHPGGPPPGRPPPGPDTSGTATSSTSSSTEAADTNRDGKVSEAERQAYAAKETAAATTSSAPSSARAAAAYQKHAGDGPGSDLMSRISSIVDTALPA